MGRGQKGTTGKGQGKEREAKEGEGPDLVEFLDVLLGGPVG